MGLILKRNKFRLIRTIINRSGNVRSKCYEETVGKKTKNDAQNDRLSPSSKLIRAIFTPSTPTNKTDLVQYVINNVLFYQRGEVLAVNKPYGISPFGNRMRNDERLYKKKRYVNEDNIECDDPNTSKLSINSVVSILAEHFNEPDLRYAFGTGRPLTGPVIFACNENAMSKICRGLTTGVCRAHIDGGHYRALAITIGRPENEEGDVNGYITFTKVGDHYEYVFVEERPKKKQDLITYRNVGARLRYRVVATSSGCSLIDLRLSKFSRHAPRLILTHLCCPILGDRIYQRRVARIHERPVLVDAKHASTGRQYIPEQLVRRLAISFEDYLRRLPMFLHVYQTTIPNYAEKNTDLVISTPPPDHFVAMVECLGLTRLATNYLQKECQPSAD